MGILELVSEGMVSGLTRRSIPPGRLKGLLNSALSGTQPILTRRNSDSKAGSSLFPARLARRMYCSGLMSGLESGSKCQGAVK